MLTDKQWQVTEIILDTQQRKRKYPLREIMNANMPYSFEDVKLFLLLLRPLFEYQG